MKFTVIIFVLCVMIYGNAQLAEFEKEALVTVQRIPASSLDDRLASRPFGVWFKEVAGEQAGVVWQLSECGNPADSREKEKSVDMPACAEVNALLPNGLKVVVMVLVGTFMKGMKGSPSFFGAVIEYQDQFYRVGRLRDLPKLVHDPGKHPVDLPGVTAKQALLEFHFQPQPQPEAMELESGTDGDGHPEALPEPPPKVKVAEVVAQGWAVTRVKPEYPAAARKMNAYGPVEVRILISPDGKVIEATAISGHLALRNAAVRAARSWVFKPTTVDGKPVITESILTIVFSRDSK